MKKSAGLPTKADSPAPAENKKCTAARATCARWCHKIGTPRMGAIHRAHEGALLRRLPIITCRGEFVNIQNRRFLSKNFVRKAQRKIFLGSGRRLPSMQVEKTGKNKVTWEAVDGAQKYEVYRSSSKSGTYKKMYTTVKTSYINTTAVAGKKYYYKVKAIHKKAAANSAYSNTDYATVR